MKYAKLVLLIVFVNICTIHPTVHAQSKEELQDVILNSEGLQAGDVGWLEARYAACKLKYYYDDDIFKNCYEEGKAQHTYMLTASLLEGTPEWLVIEKRCKKNLPIWKDVLACSGRIMQALNDE